MEWSMSEPDSLRVLIDTPPGFTGLPLTSDNDVDQASVAGLAEQVSGHTEVSAHQLTQYLAPIAAEANANNVRLFGKFAVGDSEPMLATLVMAVARITEEPNSTLGSHRGALAASLLRKYRERNPQADSRTLSLPIGPAVAGVVTGSYRLPPDVTGDSEEVIRPVFRTELQIPTPDGQTLIFLTISADNASNSENLTMLAESAMTIAQSVRIDVSEDARWS